MASIECPVCRNQINSAAMRCPRCGTKVFRKTSLVSWIGTLVVVAVIYIASQILIKQNSTDNNSVPAQAPISRE